MTELIDKPTLTVEQLFGSLGGLFNLWIGITFFTLIELFDLCYIIAADNHCCCSCCRNRQLADGGDEERVAANGQMVKNPPAVNMKPSDTGQNNKVSPQVMQGLPKVN